MNTMGHRMSIILKRTSLQINVSQNKNCQFFPKLGSSSLFQGGSIILGLLDSVFLGFDSRISSSESELDSVSLSESELESSLLDSSLLDSAEFNSLYCFAASPRTTYIVGYSMIFFPLKQVFKTSCGSNL